MSLSLVFSHYSSISYCHIRGVCILPGCQIPDGYKHSQFNQNYIQSLSEYFHVVALEDAIKTQFLDRAKIIIINSEGSGSAASQESDSAQSAEELRSAAPRHSRRASDHTFLLDSCRLDCIGLNTTYLDFRPPLHTGPSATPRAQRLGGPARPGR